MMNVIAGPNPLELLLLVLLGGGFGMPTGVPPTEEDPLAAKIAPGECLFYASWAGTGTPDATSSNQTEQLLAEPEIQEFLKTGRGRLLEAMGQAAPPDAKQTLKDVSRLLQLVQGKPGAFFISELRFDGNGPPAVKGGGLLRVDDDAAEIQKVLDELQGRAPEGSISVVKLGDRTFSRVLLDEDAPPVTWGMAGPYLLVGLGDGSLEGLMQRARGQVPGWLTNVRAKLAVPRVSSMMYIDVNGVVQMATEQSGSPEAGQIVSALGLDKIRSFTTVSGLDDKGCLSRSLLTVDGTGTGLLSWIDAKPLVADDLKMIVHDAPAALAFKLDASGLLDLWLDLASQLEPRAADGTRQGLAHIEQQLGFNVREDLLNSLGDTWRIFAQPGPTALINGWTIAIKVNDRQKLERVQEILVTAAKTDLERAGPDAPSFRTDTVNGYTMYTLAFSQPGIPVSPSWCVTDDELFITATPQLLRPLLSGGSGGRSLTQRPDVEPLFTGNANTLALAYLDTGEVAKTILPLLPGVLQAFNQGIPTLDTSTSNLPPAEVFVRHLQPTVVALRRTGDGVEMVSRQTLPGGNVGASVPILAAMGLPGIGAAREAARRVESTNNLKQIGLAMHNYHDTFGAFPAGYNADADGKPLLSWRVHILPFVEEGQLYEQFHLDEPWDSPHNKELIAQMPEVYRSPNSRAEPGKANYLGIGGADGIFVRPKPGDKSGTKIMQITDGTSNTIMAVEVPDESAVIWTKPGDFAPNKEDPTRGLLGVRPGGFLAGFTDGSVQFIAESIDAGVLNGFFTKSGGEVVR
jgi:hypothetical protein